VVVLRPDANGASGHYWQMLDDRWFAPLAAALRGAAPEVQLQIGASTWRLPDRSLLRWMRRPRGGCWHMLASAGA
jgi:hypothetical protein